MAKRGGYNKGMMPEAGTENAEADGDNNQGAGG